jgi:hypothetical protein
MIEINNGKGLIRVQKNEYKGKYYIDIRKFYEDKDSGEWLPTKKGISIPIDLAQKIIEAITKETTSPSLK